LDERGKRCRAVAADFEIDRLEALEVLVVRVDELIEGADRDGLRAGLQGRARGAVELIAITMRHAPEIDHVEAEDDIRLRQHAAAARALVERMLIGEV